MLFVAINPNGGNVSRCDAPPPPPLLISLPNTAEIQISEKDYFARAKEFKVWLFKKKKTFFEDLTSEQSHELFGKFVKDWNRCP